MIFASILACVFAGLWIRAEAERIIERDNYEKDLDWYHEELEKWKPQRNSKTGRFV